jgi:hypothetical protein
MQGKQSFRQISHVPAVALVALLFSSPAGAQTDYPMQVVTPNYIEAGNMLSLSGDDTYQEIALPFPFTFYGVPYDRAWVSTNGYMNFLGPSSVFSNSCPIFGGDMLRAAIYAFWDDLFVDGAASVRTQELGTAPGRQFVIEWRNVRFFNSATKRISFEIVLSETGTITLQYRDINDDFQERGGSATIGLENEKMGVGSHADQFSCNTPSIGPGEYAIRFGRTARTVAADIKPGGCPNPFNVGSKGVLPFAVLGMADFDVTMIDPKTVTLEGVAALRSALEDVGTPYEPLVGKTDPYHCTALGPDGYLDMTFKFDTEEVVAALGTVKDGEVRVLQLRGKLLDGTEISGEDVVTILSKGKK